MSLLVKEQSSYVPPPAGTHYARCFAVVDLGTQPDQKFGPRPKVMLMFELPHERVEFEEDGKKKERPATISKEYGASLGKKADLRKHLDAWRGKAFTEEELKGFNLQNVVGAPCVINIQHFPKLTGGVNAKVTAVASPPKGTQVPDLFHKAMTYDIGEGNQSEGFKVLPEWVRTKIAKCIEWSGETAPEPEEPNGHMSPEDDGDPVPF